MPDYLARHVDGHTIAILEAADTADADLYAMRNLKGWDGKLVTLAVAEVDANQNLFESFRDIGLSDRGAAFATIGRTTGRDSAPMVQRIKVPHQAASEWAMTESQKKLLTGNAGGPGGPSKTTVTEAAKCAKCGWAMEPESEEPTDGVKPPRKIPAHCSRPGCGTARDKKSDLKESFRALGLSEKAAEVAARGRG